MRDSVTIVLSQPLMLILTSCDNMSKKSEEIVQTPVAKRVAKELVAHGDTRVDHYYWMRLTDEQKLAKTPDQQTQNVLDYLEAENQYVEAKLGHTTPLQDKLFEEIKGRIKQQDESVPYIKNGYWYYTRFEVGQEYPIYCRKNRSLEAPEEILLNVNDLASGYDYYSVAGLSISPDNRLLAFSEDTLSRRIYTVKFIDLRTGEFLKDEIPNVQGVVAWANDNKTVFYTAKNEVTLLSEKIMRHSLGSDIQDDDVVYHEKDPSFYIGVHRSKSGKYIIIGNSSTLASDYHILSTDDPYGKFKQFTAREKEMEYSIDHFNDKFYIITNWNAINFRLMETNERSTNRERWKEVIAHRKDVLLEEIELFDRFLVVEERKNGQTNLRIINQENSEEHYLDFGESAYTAYISVNLDFSSEVLRFGYSSLTTPNSTFDYNMRSKTKTLMKQQEVVGGHDPGEYKSERLFVDSRDGIKIPVSIVSKKGYDKNAIRPLLLYAYGSYGSTIDPYFSSVRLSLLNRGFAFAIAHVRGGQMLGRQWYEDGKLLKKQNTFNDFIDCAQYLLDNDYCTAGHIYAQGGSAGGLLMGAVLNAEPMLFNGMIAAVPFVDVVTTMSDPTIPLTTNEYDEWGNPESEEYYNYLKSYSPYDNIEAKVYTNLLVTTGLFDSQVQYWEPAKWIAKLREFKKGDHLLLMHTNMGAGHGGASGRFKQYKEVALEYAFLLSLEGISE